MAKISRSRFCTVLAISAGLIYCENTAAITADEVTSKMSADQRFGFLAGLIEMATYQAALSGDRARAQCIHDAFYDATAPRRQDDAWRRLNEALHQFSDKRAATIVTLLIQRSCG